MQDDCSDVYISIFIAPSHDLIQQVIMIQQRVLLWANEHMQSSVLLQSHQLVTLFPQSMPLNKGLSIPPSKRKPILLLLLYLAIENSHLCPHQFPPATLAKQPLPLPDTCIDHGSATGLP